MALSKFTNDIYPIGLIIGTANDMEELNKTYKDISGEYMVLPVNAGACTFRVKAINSKNENNICVILIDKPTIRIITHESYHVVSKMMRITGIAPNIHTEESFAYLIGWIAEKIYEYSKYI